MLWKGFANMKCVVSSIFPSNSWSATVKEDVKGLAMDRFPSYRRIHAKGFSSRHWCLYVCHNGKLVASHCTMASD